MIREDNKVLRYGTTDPRYHLGAEPTRTWREPSWSKQGTSRHLKTYDPDWYASLPRDPQKLMDAISRAEAAREGTGLAYDFEEVYSEVLRSGLAPADIRSALFTGLAETPGMVVEHGIATLDGRSGVAIGAQDSHWRMIFDQTGRYLGERSTDPSFPATPGLDADKTTWLTSVNKTVVDKAPKVRRTARFALALRGSLAGAARRRVDIAAGCGWGTVVECEGTLASGDKGPLARFS